MKKRLSVETQELAISRFILGMLDGIGEASTKCQMKYIIIASGFGKILI